jgi:hypothetical protein
MPRANIADLHHHHRACRHVILGVTGSRDIVFFWVRDLTLSFDDLLFATDLTETFPDGIEVCGGSWLSRLLQERMASIACATKIATLTVIRSGSSQVFTFVSGQT